MDHIRGIQACVDVALVCKRDALFDGTPYALKIARTV